MKKFPVITLKAARVNANLTQKKAAEKIGVSEATLQNWENGITSPTMEKADKISEIYGISKDYIFFGNKLA